MEEWKTLLCVSAIGVLIAIYMRHGGEAEMDALSTRIGQRLSYWHYKCSLWWNTRKIRHSYRYITCKQCGCKNRVKKQQEQCICCSCNQPIQLRKKGKKL